MASEPEIGLIDATDAILWLVLTPRTDDPQQVRAQASFRIPKRAAARYLRSLADQWEKEAAASDN